jgi:hypothetical protein
MADENAKHQKVLSLIEPDRIHAPGWLGKGLVKRASKRGRNGIDTLHKYRKGIVTVTRVGGPGGMAETERMKPSPDPKYRHCFLAEVISHAVWLYHVFSLSLRDVEVLLAERGIVVS